MFVIIVITCTSNKDLLFPIFFFPRGSLHATKMVTAYISRFFQPAMYVSYYAAAVATASCSTFDSTMRVLWRYGDRSYLTYSSYRSPS